MPNYGKISRLPQDIREQLNRRLDNGEPGEALLAWLNSLPQVQDVVQSQFDGRPISPQNLSEWKKRGYREWQRHQERLEFFQQLQPGAAELGQTMDAQAFHRQYSMVLAADLALAVREVMDEVADPEKKAEALGKLAGRFAQLRREESNAVRAQVIQEQWDRDKPDPEDSLDLDLLAPSRALMLHRQYIEKFSQPEHARAAANFLEPLTRPAEAD